MKTDFKMTKEQKALFDALTPLQQKVCINIVSGMSNIDAFMLANKKIKDRVTGEASVSRMLRDVKVRAFIDSMKAAAVSSAVMSRERMLELHTKIADIGNAAIDQMSLEELTEHKAALDIKLKAMNQLADLAGYKAASKHELSNPDGSLKAAPSVIQLVAPKE
ncbi:putative phage terminase, small subunit [Marinomonas phage P12026]|uniref:putative phage terminase, small subunit n=1 Tax=Marinomonas phage P12026 TaxID=1176423 RepID=UPI0002688F2B|nr:putative phage terminase, small subunit [Marinomonas phage P12026]AFM54847.1 putative phage terminase, small subunit [Marinomonas phage P12026]